MSIPSLSVPLGEWVLLTHPRYASLGLVLQCTTIALFLLIPCFLLVWLYVSELRLVKSVTAVTLLTFRLVVVFLLWTIVMWQPSFTKTESEERPTRVLVAVDHSESMDLTDAQRSSLEKLRIAQSLELYPETKLPVDSLLDEWIRHYEKSKQAPNWPPSLEGRQQKQLHDQILKQMDLSTRRDLALKVLEGQATPLIEQLTRKHEVEIIGFDNASWTLPTKKIEEAKRPKKISVGRSTDLRHPLRYALENPSGEADLLGIVLLSDGQHNQAPRTNTEPALLKQTDNLGRQNVPIFPVLVAPKEGPKDVSVVAVVVPPNDVPKGTEAQVTAKVLVSGMVRQEVIVELLHEKKVLVTKKKVVSPKSPQTNIYDIPLSAKIPKSGRQKITVRVRLKDKTVTEVSKANNTAHAFLRVAKDRARVLLVESDARWEYHYLASALERDKTIEPDSVLFVQPRIKAVSEAELKKIDHPALQFPPWTVKEAPDPILDYECIVLGDVSPEVLSVDDRKRIAAYVGDHGGTLVVIPGKRWMPLEFVKTPDDPLAKLFPMEKMREVRSKKGFRLTKTIDGGARPFLRLHPKDDVNARRWASLRPHYWAVIGEAKPGAKTLGYARPSELGLNTNAEKTSEETAREHSVLVLQNYGFGRVLYLGVDSTWRWRFRVGDLYHHTFWGQVIRWAAAGKLLPSGNKYVRYGSQQPVYTKGEDVEIVARLSSLVEKLPESVRANIYNKNDPKKLVDSIILKQKPNTRFFEGKKGINTGNYHIEIDIPGYTDELKRLKLAKTSPTDQDNTFVVLSPPDTEKARLDGNTELLESLAKTTGGETITLSETERVLSLLENRMSPRQKRVERKLWRDGVLTWYVLGVFLVFVTMEWIVRKSAGLP
ncbi:MAG: hypothetical protein ACFCD0_19920 [Gemmataceae bacterium]